jgi:hypothetical protein
MPLAANGKLFGALIVFGVIAIAVMVVYSIKKMRSDDFWDEQQ